jgi:hypothetical protein
VVGYAWDTEGTPGYPGGGGVMERNATRPEAAWYELLWHSTDRSSQYGGGFQLVITN